eukprot:4855164-Prymnesium_polylepis.3
MSANATDAQLVYGKLEVLAPICSRAEQHVARADAPLPILGKGRRRCGHIDGGVDHGRRRGLCDRHDEGHQSRAHIGAAMFAGGSR